VIATRHREGDVAHSRSDAGVLKGQVRPTFAEAVRGLPLDRRSDLFGASPMIYECLTSEAMFQG